MPNSIGEEMTSLQFMDTNLLHSFLVNDLLYQIHYLSERKNIKLSRGNG